MAKLARAFRGEHGRRRRCRCWRSPACAKDPAAEPGGLALGVGSGGAVAAPGSPQDFVVNVGDRVFFETDSTELTAQAQGHARSPGALAQPVFALPLHHRGPRRRARHARVQHRARRPPRGERQATTSSSRGVAANRMQTISYGKERPVAVCNDISCWSQNRRAVTVLGERRDLTENGPARGQAIAKIWPNSRPVC